MHLTPLGPEFESVIAATTLFLAGGALSFICCFCITHGYLWHKRRIYRRRLRHEWREDSTTEIINVHQQQQPYAQKVAGQKANSYVVVEVQQPPLKRVIMLEANDTNQQQQLSVAADQQSTKMNGKTNVIEGRRPSSLKQQQQIAHSNHQRQKPAANNKRRPATMTTTKNGRNTSGKVAFDCGSSTEETNSS